MWSKLACASGFLCAAIPATIWIYYQLVKRKCDSDYVRNLNADEKELLLLHVVGKRF